VIEIKRLRPEAGDAAVKPAAAPPELLYHGTGSSGAERILSEGVKPMTRQYLHL